MAVIETDVKECPCPSCGVPLDVITGEGTPKEGDFSMCLECFTFLRVNADLTVRALEEGEFDSQAEETKQFLLQEKHINMLAKLRCGRMPADQLVSLLDTQPSKNFVITTYYHKGMQFIKYGEYSSTEGSTAILQDTSLTTNIVLAYYNDNTYALFTRKVH